VRHLLPPRVEHLQALRLARVIPYLRRDVALRTPLCIPRPVLGQRQAEVEQGMVVARDVAPEHTDLAVIDLTPLAAPLRRHPVRRRAAFGEPARIAGDDAIGLAQPLGYLTHQHPDQRPMVPWCDTDKVLQDLSLDIDPGRACLGILAWQMRQEPLE